MGALLKQRLEHGPFSKPVQAQVDKILLQLFQLHKKSTANKGAVQFFHISKSGGTNLCQSAQQNGCATEVRAWPPIAGLGRLGGGLLGLAAAGSRYFVGPSLGLSKHAPSSIQSPIILTSPLSLCFMVPPPGL